MAHIWLLRHAKSAWDTAAPDFSRPLSGRGLDDAPRMGKWISEHGAPTTVVASPATRAAETVLLAGSAWGLGADEVVWDRRIYGASLQALVDVLDGHDGDRLMCGHNPGFDELLVWLLAEAPPRSDSGKLMATCTAACVEVPDGALRRGAGRLVCLQRPKEL